MSLLSFFQNLFGAPPPALQLITEEGWHDVTVFISNYESKTNGTQIIEWSAKDKGKVLRYKVILSTEWQATKLGPIDAFVGTVEFVSVGAESDHFARFIDETYGTKLGIRQARSKSLFSAITLAGNPKALKDEPVKIKLFYESDDEEKYAEFYFNIDLKEKKAEIKEKDEGYRPSVVLAFGQQ